MNFAQMLLSLFVFIRFPRQVSGLEEYIISNKPLNTSDVEKLTREYEVSLVNKRGYLWSILLKKLLHWWMRHASLNSMHISLNSKVVKIEIPYTR